MIWLTWRQFRTAATAVFAGLAVLAALLAVTGPGIADDYAAGIATCTEQPGGCEDFVKQFFIDHQGPVLAVTLLMLVLPALIGLFWGAPLVTRELEAGTHQLAWNQSVTRTRWLAVKLGLTGLAAAAAAGLGSLAVTWWSSTIDQIPARETYSRLASPIVFAARDIVPIGYAAFAFALGVAVGMLVRRTLPAMAITLAVFVAVQVAMPMLVRPHLLPPSQATLTINESVLASLNATGPDGPLRVETRAPGEGDWLLSGHTVDASGKAVDSVPLTPSSEACSLAEGMSGCLAEIERLGYRQHVTYHPASRFWPFQWIEAGSYLALAIGLAGFSFWWIRRRVS